MIYLDNAATMPVFLDASKTAEIMMRENYFNASATYSGGIDVRREIDASRSVIAKKLNCKPNEIYFTSCATECNNWILRSGFKNKNGNIVISGGEHASVFECAKAMKSEGLDVRFAPLNAAGETEVDSILALVDENTQLVSVIHVSNETGVVNDISSLSRAVKAKNPRAIFHSDGVQAFLKTANDVRALGVDAYSISGHKIGAPKGIGALYISEKIALRPLLYGGGQESGLRSGTENAPAICAFREAINIFSRHYNRDIIDSLNKAFIEKLRSANGRIFGENAHRTGMIIAFSLPNTRAEIIQTMCADEGVIVGRGSACSSRHNGNRVLEEMKIDRAEIGGALRVSLSPCTTEQELLTAADTILKNAEKLRGGRIG